MSTRIISAETSGGAEKSGPTMNFATHLRRIVRLAVPMIVARAGLLIMIAVDTAMIGHYGTLDLAFYAAANALQVVMILVGVGLLQDTVVLVAWRAAWRPPRSVRSPCWPVCSAQCRWPGIK
jgi:Na+-driven multidrug efflux pump